MGLLCAGFVILLVVSFAYDFLLVASGEQDKRTDFEKRRLVAEKAHLQTMMGELEDSEWLTRAGLQGRLDQIEEELRGD